MLVTIHTIADLIIIRKTQKWKCSDYKTHEEVDIEGVYTQMHLFMNRCLVEISTQESKVTTTHQCLLNLYSLMQKLSLQAWSIPTKLNKAEYLCFLHDLDFYLMISGLLVKAISLFNGFIPPDKNLSTVQVLPSFCSHPKKVRWALNQLPDRQWIQTINFYQQHNEYLNTLDQIIHYSSCKKTNLLLNTFIHTIESICAQAPTSQLDEEYRTHILVKINYQLETITDSNNDSNSKKWIEIRAVLILGMMIDSDHTLKEIYLRQLHQQKQQADFIEHDELAFIKNQLKAAKKIYKEYFNSKPDFTHDFNELIIYLSRIKTYQSLNDPDNYIVWNHNPKEFVRKLHSIIAKGHINIKGNTDLLPIVEVISKFVKVRKLNNTGNLSKGSLLSYFKKANTGDL